MRRNPAITAMARAFRRRRTEMGLVMKRKILALGLLSLCSVALFVGDAKAWNGPLSLWLHHHRYTTTITCRPYNAFTPICWGNLVCDGCNPNPCSVANGCLPMMMGAPPWACCPPQGYGMPPMGGMAMMPPGAYGPGAGYATDMGTGGQPMPMPAGQPMPQQFTPPTPMPIGPTPNTTMTYPYPYPALPPGVAQANYHPGYYPIYPQPAYPNYNMPTYYNPNPGYPNMQPMPYYWYPQGR